MKPHAEHNERGAGVSPVTERQCGSCSLCCTALRVDELGKLAGVPCQKLSVGGGCSIHATRPQVCRDYRCHWLKGGLEGTDRPDRLGALVDFAPNALGLHLAIVESAPGVFDRSNRLREIADSVREQMPVRVSDLADVMNPDRAIRVLEREDRELVIQGDRVRTYSRGELVSDARLPFIERSVRHLQQKFARLRIRVVGAVRRRRFEQET